MAAVREAPLSTTAIAASTALALSRALTPAHLHRLVDIDVKRTRAANYLKERYSHGQLCAVAVDVLRGVVGQRGDECHPADVWLSMASRRRAAATLRGIAYTLDGPEPCYEINNKIKRAKTGAHQARDAETFCSVMSPTEPYDSDDPPWLARMLAEDSPIQEMPPLLPLKTRRAAVVVVDLTDDEERCERVLARHSVGGG